ncbi:putative lipid II flippase FtsW [Propioniciclava sp.]|uniref:putative lipid II flippase FtsW n=1 Tax=Propioniciclava sp. TaxID=2038686 RepID=UPI00262928FD|nr:putative lipid II flippase FtsW [Propioniciclava sp.]
MAILTPSKPPRTSNRPRPTERSALATTASAWLNHPMADVVLVGSAAGLLLALGSIMVWSASTVFSYTQFGDAFYFMKRQVVFLVVGIVAGWIASRISVTRLRSMGWLIFGVAGLLLVLTFTPLGYRVGGNTNWLNLGGEGSMLRLQPAEFAKIAIVVWGAAVLANKRKLLDQPKHLLVPFLPFSLLLIGLVILQHDLGTAIIMGGLVVAVLWCVGAPFRVLGTLGVVVAGGLGALVLANPSRIARIGGFLDPAADPSGVNHQPMQALYGLATGGWFGVGLGHSRQKWGSLSQAHTDYVLAIIGEELGLIGTLAVIALFVVLGYAGVRIALRSSTFFGRLVAAGVTSWIMMQALVNIMVVLRLLPVLGVPLPLVSYGGSALLANLIALGVLVACGRDEPDARAWLKRRARARAPRRRISAVLPGRS